MSFIVNFKTEEKLEMDITQIIETSPATPTGYVAGNESY